MLFKKTVSSRIRVIIDNDFGGDPDGLFQLVHHILSPSVEIRGIIGSHLYKDGFYDSPGTAANACKSVNKLLNIMQLNEKLPVYEGANAGLSDVKAPVISEGAKAIVQEAMKEDTKKPLYVVCGAGLTNIASAYLIESGIAKHIILIWIGGSEYNDLAIPQSKYKNPEYNLGIDIKAAQVIFNFSDIPLWQVPRDAYRQALISYAELLYKVKDKGLIGKFLTEKIEDLMQKEKRLLGEAYILGDSPLVLLTALQSSWEPDPSSSKYVIKKAPKINNSGLYEENHEGRNIRVYTNLDIRLMFEDFFIKLALFNTKK